MLRSFTLAPHRVPKETLLTIAKAQQAFNAYHVAAAHDDTLLHNALAPLAALDSWSRRELQAHRATASTARAKPMLLLPNCIFQQHAADDASLTCTCANVQAGEPYQLQLVHALHAADAPGVQGGPLAAVCRALERAARLVHPSAPCVVMVAKPTERLALRTRIDLRGVGEQLATLHGVRVLYASMRELAAARLDGSGDLVLGGERISVVYSRYDFSHPWGRFSPSPVDDDASAELDAEWGTVERMESSNAILSSSLAFRLAHRRAVQHESVRRGGLERLLPPDEAATLRRLLPRQWALADDEERDEVSRLLAREPDGYVAKNILRPRTGSGATQSRTDTAGDIISSPHAVAALLRDEVRRSCFVVYPRVEPPSFATTVMHNGEAHELESISEVASYGCVLDDRPRVGANAAETMCGGEKLQVNDFIGVGARTRPASSEHPLASVLGYGALSTVQCSS